MPHTGQMSVSAFFEEITVILLLISYPLDSSSFLSNSSIALLQSKKLLPAEDLLSREQFIIIQPPGINGYLFMGQGSFHIIIRRCPSILRIFHIHMFIQIIFLIQNWAFSTHQQHCLPVIQKAYFIECKQFYAPLSSDEFNFYCER